MRVHVVVEYPSSEMSDLMNGPGTSVDVNTKDIYRISQSSRLLTYGPSVVRRRQTQS